MTILKSFEKPLTPEEEIYYLSLLKNEDNEEAKEVLYKKHRKVKVESTCPSWLKSLVK